MTRIDSDKDKDGVTVVSKAASKTRAFIVNAILILIILLTGIFIYGVSALGLYFFTTDEVSGRASTLDEIQAPPLEFGLEPLNNAKQIRFRYLRRSLSMKRLELTGRVDKGSFERFLNKHHSLVRNETIRLPRDTIYFFSPDFLDGLPKMGPHDATPKSGPRDIHDSGIYYELPEHVKSFSGTPFSGKNTDIVYDENTCTFWARIDW